MKHYIVFFCACAALLLGSCSKENESTPREQGRALTITVAVDGNDAHAALKVGTRATDDGYATAFDAGDAIGIYVYEGGTQTFSNKKWIFDGTSWAPATAEDNIYYGSATLTLRAYYPYDGDAAALPVAATFTVQADQSKAGSYRASDLLLSADASWSGAALPVALNFSHAMALVEAFPLNASPMTSVTLCVVATGDGGAAANITMHPMGDGKWRAAIPAQTFAAKSQIAFDYGTAGAYAYAVSGSATAAAVRKFTVTTLPAAVGDYYYADGSYSTALNDSRTPIGIVYWLDPANPGHGKIVSLNEFYDVVAWSYGFDADATDEDDGLLNMAAIAGLNEWSNYPAFNLVNSKNPDNTTYATGAKGIWYLPAKNELKALSAAYCGKRYEDIGDWWGDEAFMPEHDDLLSESARAAFDKKLTAAGGQALTGNEYWSSTQRSGIEAWYIYLNSGFMAYNIKPDRRRVRAVSAF